MKKLLLFSVFFLTMFFFCSEVQAYTMSWRGCTLNLNTAPNTTFSAGNRIDAGFSLTCPTSSLGFAFKKYTAPGVYTWVSQRPTSCRSTFGINQSAGYYTGGAIDGSVRTSGSNSICTVRASFQVPATSGYVTVYPMWEDYVPPWIISGRENERCLNLGSFTIPFTVRPTPINGTCGSAAGTYAWDASSFRGSFCSAGTASPLSPIFPSEGKTTTWRCIGSDGGSTRSCSAYRDIGTPVAPNVTGSCGANSQVSVDWNDVSGATYYAFRLRDLDSSIPWEEPFSYPYVVETIQPSSYKYNGVAGGNYITWVHACTGTINDLNCGAAAAAYVSCPVSLIGSFSTTDISGSITFKPILTAKKIKGNAAGAINYKFDCGNGTIKTYSTTATTQIHQCSYNTSGTYSASVIMTQQGATATPSALSLQAKEGGKCNLNVAKDYDCNESSYVAGSPCTLGISNPNPKPPFPNPGETVSWTCTNDGITTTCPLVTRKVCGQINWTEE